ncbi:MAG: tetratricopeptide repeat protein, partial [Bryobacteraceae bacterium]
MADRATSLLLTLLAASASVASQSLREAARLDEEGRCEEAERHYRALLAQGSPSGALLNNAANHYLICGQTDKAHDYFERILRTNPTHGNANFQLARIAAERRQGSKALEYLARVKRVDPQTLLVRAEALHWSGQKSASSSILDGLEKAAVGDGPMLFLLGLSCARLGMYERAEAAFNHALSLQPGDFDITFALGRSAARAEHYDRAQSALEAALRLRPDDTNVLVELGRVSAARQDYVRAVFHLAQARKKASENADILLLLARAAEDAGYYEDAANAYDEYLRLRPGEDTVRRDRARAYGQTESRLEQASKEIDWYLARHADDAQGHYIAAQIVWGVKPGQALHHLTEAVRLDPESVSIRFSRAWMLQRAGQMTESLTDLEVARRLAPDNARILDLIGLAHLALDRPADAEKVLRVALAKAPDEPEVIMHLGRALMALGRETEAQTYMEKYRAIRPQALPGLRKRFGMIELATLTAAEQRRREIERFRRESRDHPDRPDYQLNLSSLLLADGRKEEALQEFRRLLTLNPGSEVLEEAGSVLLTA